MTCVSALSRAADTSDAIEEVLEKLRTTHPDGAADLTLVFSSVHHADELNGIAATLLDRGLTRHVLGCTGESIIGEDREVEGDPALAVWSIDLPGVEVEPIRLERIGQPAVQRLHQVEDRQKSVVLFLGDPFSFRIDDFLKAVNEEARGVSVIGGMASGSQVPRGNQLLLDRESYLDGAVAVLLTGPLSVRTVVSQGCRPIGRTMLVTKAENNVIRELGRRPAVEALREVFQELPPQDQ